MNFKMLKIELLLGLMLILFTRSAVGAALSNQNSPVIHDDKVDYVITKARLREIRSQFMYWFFDIGGSNNEGDWQSQIQNSSPQLQKDLNLELPFFGFRFNYTRVSLNGYLEFSDPSDSITYPLVFPTQKWPKENDPSFIGIFYSKCRIGKLRDGDLDKRKPGVYFRTERNLQSRTDQFGVELRERTKGDIREGIIGAQAFDPKHVIIVTWKNVTFAGSTDNASTITNTFQIVLATNEIVTYAIYNYLDLQWAAHTEAGGNPETGEGGIPAYVGFNAGNGTRAFEYSPFSQSSSIRGLTEQGWSNGFKGRHIFRLDENILASFCNEDIDSATLPLLMTPESGNMLGGTIVNITGPCLAKTDKVKCLFDTEEVSGIVIDSNRAICVQPQLFAEGYVILAISINGNKYKWKGKYFVETPTTAKEKIIFENNAVYEKMPSEISISWNHQNLSTDPNALVKISLWGYRETTNPELLYIDQISTGAFPNGHHTILTEAFKHRNNADLTDVHFGFLQINVTDDGFNSLYPSIIWSKPIPLAWYFRPQWERKYGDKWSKDICNEWIASDQNLSNFTQDLPECPCTLTQALANKGRYLPDPECDKDLYPKCQHHRAAVHCVLTGTQTPKGSDQQCCYDKNSYLMLSQDQQWGSSPRRSSNLGSIPWNRSTVVPSLSHWYHDIAPKYFCCLWQNEQSDGCKTLRLERRPSQTCVNYQGPAVAGIYGDPHVMTFKDLQYTFNGKGEFVLLRSNTEKVKLDVQGRFEQMPRGKIETVRGTQLTSVVARGNSSTVIEVRLRPRDSQWRYRLDVFANNKRVYFDNPSLKFQHFPGVTVYTPTYILNQSEVIVMFESGAGLEVVENNGYMNARVYLPDTFKNQTRGLLGSWSTDVLNDLVTPDGHIIEIPTGNDMERIYHDFGLKWMVNDRYEPNKGVSLFLREWGRTSNYFNNATFQPDFEMRPALSNSSLVTEEDIDRVCGNDAQCFYDYAVTMKEDLAKFTHNFKTSLINIKEMNRKK